MNHDVFNQPPPLVNYNLFSTDRALRDAVKREGAGWAWDRIEAYGARLGTAEAIHWGELANLFPPVLHTHDRYGKRRDEVEFHPAWHALMELAVENGVHNLPWARPHAGAHVARAALAMLASENEAGHVCPISMTYSAAPVIHRDAETAPEWGPRLNSTSYDSSFQPASRKGGALIGMAMTEKQGGSDVRANTTRAESIGGREYLLDGHKWFCSAPMSDGFLTLAQAPGGLTCFFLPRWRPDGQLNGIHLQRLKQKLGNRSNASSEIELNGAWARLLGEEGRGVPTIIEMVHHTRLDCVISSAGLMRRALVEARHHARFRNAFGRPLGEQPAMRNVLADLTLESEAATLLAMRLARAFDEGDRRFSRLAVAIAKYWVSKRAMAHTAEALECLGGNGYVEESPMPRLYREAPVNSIWEGSGNVIALDVLRAIGKEPDALQAVLEEIRSARDARVNRFVSKTDSGFSEAEGRRVAERLALGLQASLLLRFSPSALGDAFCASRLEGDGGRALGTLPATVDFTGILRDEE